MPPGNVKLGMSYLLMEGEAVIAVGAREQTGPRLARMVIES